MGLSFIRGSPVSVNLPSPKHNAAQSGRIAVPALPKKSSCICVFLMGPALPTMVHSVLSSDRVYAMPSFFKALSI